jgi:hypothetical protein
MRKIFTLLLTIMTTTFLYGQTPTWEEVVYLKNGSIIRGTIIEQIPNKSLKIQTKDRSVFVYSMDEIEKIAKEEIKTEVKKGPKTPAERQRERQQR